MPKPSLAKTALTKFSVVSSVPASYAIGWAIGDYFWPMDCEQKWPKVFLIQESYNLESLSLSLLLSLGSHVLTWQHDALEKPWILGSVLTHSRPCLNKKYTKFIAVYQTSSCPSLFLLHWSTILDSFFHSDPISTPSSIPEHQPLVFTLTPVILTTFIAKTKMSGLESKEFFTAGLHESFSRCT